ncbi:hypothetical protein Tco_1287369, partial [Tanacetum coccineum]
EEDDDEDPEEDPADYPADGGDDGDDEDESSNDDKDDDVDIKGDEEEEQEHPTPANSTTVALPAVDHALSAEDTEPFETDESAATPPPHPAYRVTARISIRDEPPTPFWSDIEVARILAIPTPPPSPLSPWSSPLPQIPSPPPASLTYPLGYRATMIQLRTEAPSTSYLPPQHIILSYTRADTPPTGTPPLLPIPAPTSSPSLLLPSADHGADRAEDEMLVDMPGAPTTDDTELGRQMIEFTTRVRQDIYEIYTRLIEAEVVVQQAVITKLQAADRRRQAAITEMLAADRRRHE